MVEYKDRLMEALLLAGVDKHALAKKLKISYTGMEKALDGRTKFLSAKNNSIAAKFLCVDPDWLVTGEGTARSERLWPFKTLTPNGWWSISDELRRAAETMLISGLPKADDAPGSAGKRYVA